MQFQTNLIFFSYYMALALITEKCRQPLNFRFNECFLKRSCFLSFMEISSTVECFLRYNIKGHARETVDVS